AGADRAVRVWDPTTREEILALRGHARPMTRLCVSPDGLWLATADAGPPVRAWDCRPGLAAPPVARLPEPRRAAWHRHQLNEARDLGHWAGVALHSDRLLRAGPDARLLAWHGRASAEL